MSSNYKNWQLTYYKHIKDIRDIIIKYIPFNTDYVYTNIFFEELSLYIYNNSSKKIDKYLEPISEKDEEEYYEYLIKNNTLDK